MAAENTGRLRLNDALASEDTVAVADWLQAVDDHSERAYQVAGLSRSQMRRLGGLLDSESGIELYKSVDDQLAADVLRQLPAARVAAFLDLLDSDHAGNVMREVDDRTREAWLSALPLPRARVLRDLLAWPKHSVAAHMVPETLTVGPAMTAATAVDEIRGHAARVRSDSRTGAYIFVTDDDNRLVGVVPFRNLVLAGADRTVENLMETDVLALSPLTDQEVAAQLLIDHRLVALPVVDADRRLLGLLTADDAADIAEEEATEDAERQGGSAPLEVPYLRASPWLLWRKRIVWLLVLFAAEAYTGTVLRAFEEELDAVVALAFFIPLLIGTGGNTGTQITTTLVRAMATGQVRFHNVPAILAKEMSTGVMIALAMAAAAVIRAWTLGVGAEVTLTVTLSVAAIVLWASFVASILPPLLKKCRVDPAVVSAPMIATIVDGTGLLIYFTIAKMTLSQLAGL
ncbi:magnesium transporter MgtE [Mycolicibacterium murale]|uniref:Magnesium transporter MgtE n=1 Tax=Mycolicibacterium murale TaxID=182220 RepID=A0A7I9WTR6_9MYCO|nr:magnesium transporter [Mycolicibacterium murale]MCV7186442.1 magnesium transporter [Mycolicibacterium murale]GFG60686.1 magnesium transporter MgtE [Mycolicibacterium murale]